MFKAMISVVYRDERGEICTEIRYVLDKDIAERITDRAAGDLLDIVRRVELKLSGKVISHSITLYPCQG